MGARPDITALVEARRRRADQARQVADVLRHQALSGTFGSGVLPKEEQLCREFGVSRNTVRQALSLLVAEGLVARVPGIGTSVVTGKYPHGLHRLMGLAETLRDHGDITNEYARSHSPRAPSAVARRLRLGVDEQVVYIERVRHLGYLPLFARSDVPPARRR